MYWLNRLVNLICCRCDIVRAIYDDRTIQSIGSRLSFALMLIWLQFIGHKLLWRHYSCTHTVKLHYSAILFPMRWILLILRQQAAAAVNYIVIHIFYSIVVNTLSYMEYLLFDWCNFNRRRERMRRCFLTSTR